ncbi:MAG TPA: hypothetical protein VHA56_06560 [Mucilaginibacter sp.]|nr:hypothetical protein [Mucilaginibacter sp.]
MKKLFALLPSGFAATHLNGQTQLSGRINTVDPELPYCGSKKPSFISALIFSTSSIPIISSFDAVSPARYRHFRYADALP